MNLRALVLGILAGTSSCANGLTIHANSGDVEDKPFPVQAAIDRAMPGDTVEINPGVYNEDIRSYRDGTADKPITIKGPASAVIRGESAESIVAINHDHIHLEGFSINGSGEKREEDGDDNTDPENYHDTLLHVKGGRVRLVAFEGHVHRSAVLGFKATKLDLSHARGSCMKLSYFVTHANVHDNSITDCGKSLTKCAESNLKEEGCEGGLSLGTPLSQRMESIGGEVDECAWNAFRNNRIFDVGGPCLIVHEGSRANLVDTNVCAGSMDAKVAGVVARGSANIFRNNSVIGAAGSALAIGLERAARHGGGDGDGDDEDGDNGVDNDGHGDEGDASFEYRSFGIFNQFYNNVLHGSTAGGSLLNGVFPVPSGKACSNIVDASAADVLGQDCKAGYTTTEAGPNKINSGASSSGNHEEGTGEPEPSGSNAVKCVPATVENVRVTSSGTQEWDRADVVYGDEPEATASGGEVVLDEKDDTFWSGYGKEQWINFDFGRNHAVEPPTLVGVAIQFYRGGDRVYDFKVSSTDASDLGEEGALWTDLISDGQSSGEEAGPEVFLFPGGGTNRGIVRYVGMGSTQNGEEGEETLWNSIVSIAWCEGTPT